MGKIKIFLSDTQVLFREGIHFALSGEDDFEVVGETTNNEDALAQIKVNPPNMAILSMQNGKLTGSEATRHIRQHSPSVSVILIAEKIVEEQLFSAIESGASACLTKDTDPEQLVSTIRLVIQGNQPIIEALLMPGIASRALIEFEDLAYMSKQMENLLPGLAPKEAEILNSISTGNKIDQVAAKLDMNEETIKRTLGLIRDKLVANYQALAVIEATQRGLPSIRGGVVKMGGPSTEYVTREEFTRFKESLIQRLKAMIGNAI